MQTETWRTIEGFPAYKISDSGNVRSESSERVLILSSNQYGVTQVGLMKDGVQHHRSVPLLVAKAFIPRKFPAFDTPINKDGDRFNNSTDNLEWRPRWFAVLYNRQFKEPYPYPIGEDIMEVKTGELFENSLQCAITYGLLEEDLVKSIENRTYVWPTYQEFEIVL